MIEALQGCAQRVLALAAPARAGIDAIEQRAGALATELQACGSEQAAVDARAREATGAVTEIEIALARCDERVAEIDRRRDQLAAEHGIELVDAERPLEVDEAAAQAARLERLERRRESLGAVNPLAQEEYEQEKQRADDLTAQCDDLERSLKELRALIRDLTRTIDERFAATFDAVRPELRRGDRDAVPRRAGTVAPDRVGAAAASGRGGGGAETSRRPRPSPASS